MRMTLHLAAADDFPAYAQLVRHARMRTLRTKYPELDEERVARELGAWLPSRARTWRSASASGHHDGAPQDPNMPLLYARTLLPLTFLPPAGHWRDTTRKRALRARPAAAARSRGRRRARAHAAT